MFETFALKNEIVSFAFFVVIAIIQSCVAKESTLESWFNNVSNSSFECTQKTQIKATGPEIVKIVDCGKKDARWDYSLQFLNSKSNKPACGTINGEISISFGLIQENVRLKNVFKNKICFWTSRSDIKKVVGNFAESQLQGLATIKYEQIISKVNFVNNTLSGPIRNFDIHGRLLNITIAETDFVLLQRTEVDFFKLQIDSNEVLLTDHFKDFMMCKPISKYYFTNCSHISTQDIHYEIDRCKIDVKISEIFKPKEKEVFQWNLVRDTKRFDDDVKFTNCPNENDWSETNIKTQIQKWKNLLITLSDPFWFQELSSDPFDFDNPKIKIFLEDFSRRNNFLNHRVTILSLEGEVLYKGHIKRGLIIADIDPTSAMNEAWRLPIIIQIVNNDIELKGSDQELRIEIFCKLHRGKPHGLVLMNNVLSVDQKFQCSDVTTKGLGFVGHYDNGVPTGICWKELRGDSWLYGEVDKDGHFSGENIAYIYPDMEIALKGKFEKGQMVYGQEAKVLGVRCNENGIKVLKFSKPEGPMYYYNPPNNTFLGDQQLLIDPLDKKYVSLRTSETFPTAGQGLFAKREIPKGMTFSLMTGMVLTPDENDEWNKKFHQWASENNLSLSHYESTEKWKYKIKFQNCQAVLDIPIEYEDTSKFGSTFGHKINHSFKPNSIFHEFDSARFGMIISAKSTTTIHEGQEIFANYGYIFDNAPIWFKKLLVEFLDANPSEIRRLKNNTGGKTISEMREVIKSLEQEFEKSKN